MGKGRKVPPRSRRAPEVEGQTALAEPSPEEERTGTDVAPEGRRDQQPASFQAPASLPQRTRGAADHRPPARVARPVLPESFLERVRAAAEAARREDEQGSSATPAVVVPATTGSAFIAPPREAAATEAPATEAPATEAPPSEAPSPRHRAPAPSPGAEAPAPQAPVPDAASPVASNGLPRRVRGMSDGPQPPARVARPVLSQSLLERVRAAVQADAEAEAEDHPQEPAAIPLPRRDPARSGGPQPRARVAQPVSRPETSSPGDANTEPIPVIPVIAEPAALAQKAAPSKPEAAPALPKRKPDQAPAGAKAAEPKAAEPKA